MVKDSRTFPDRVDPEIPLRAMLAEWKRKLEDQNEILDERNNLLRQQNELLQGIGHTLYVWSSAVMEREAGR